MCTCLPVGRVVVVIIISAIKNAFNLVNILLIFATLTILAPLQNVQLLFVSSQSMDKLLCKCKHIFNFIICVYIYS